MRSREEIQEDVAISNAENNGNDTVALLQLEVLLDIRDAKTSEAKWGIYCPQHYGSWLRNPAGQLYLYPSKEVAEAHIETVVSDVAGRWKTHLWQVVEYGTQEYIDPSKEPAGSVLCPVDYEQHHRSVVNKTTTG